MADTEALSPQEQQFFATGGETAPEAAPAERQRQRQSPSTCSRCRTRLRRP